MANQYKNKVVYNGTTLIDLSQDTVTSASHILKGYVGHLADGTQVTGTAESGSSEQVTEIVVAEQTVTPESDYTRLTIVEPLISGTKYIYTVNGVETTGIAFDYYGSVVLGNPSNYEDGTGMMIESVNNQIYLDTKLRTPFTVKVEKVVSEGSSSATLITKTITENGTYTALNDSADGYSEVVVNVSSGSSESSRTSIVPEQTGNYTERYNQINFVAPLVVGEVYIYTIDGAESQSTAFDNYGSIALGAPDTTIGFEYANGVMYLSITDSSLRTTHTIKIEQESSSGNTRTTIVAEQTITVSSEATNIQYITPLILGETYIYTINGVEYTQVAWNDNVVALGSSANEGEIGYINNNMYFFVDSSSQYGTYTIKVEQESSGSSVSLQTKSVTYTPTTSQQTASITADSGYDGLSEVDITVNAIPSQYIVPTGNKAITENGNNIDVTEYATVSVSVASGGGSTMNVQTEQSTSRRNNTALGSVTSLTCSTAGTYDVYWSCARSSTSQTWGSQLYINGTAYGTENTTWTNHVQNNHLTGVTIPANATVAIYGRSRSGYYIYVPQLTIIQTA